jgi:hypothetical protein
VQSIKKLFHKFLRYVHGSCEDAVKYDDIIKLQLDPLVIKAKEGEAKIWRADELRIYSFPKNSSVYIGASANGRKDTDSTGSADLTRT